MVKAVGGGGGRGLRAVHEARDLADAYARCRSEAGTAFGIDAVYVERLMRGARHVEIQVVGDGDGVASLGERDCSVQRRFQKLVEIAPSPALPGALRAALTDAALRLAGALRYRNLGTFEFLVGDAAASPPWVFIEANPRLQVEHTVSEAVTGLDLVQMQLRIASGASLAEPRPCRRARRRRSAATPCNGGSTPNVRRRRGRRGRPTGRLERFDLPSGPGLRCDTHA